MPKRFGAVLRRFAPRTCAASSNCTSSRAPFLSARACRRHRHQHSRHGAGARCAMYRRLFAFRGRSAGTAPGRGVGHRGIDQSYRPACDDLRAAGRDVVFAVGRLHTDAAVDSLSKVPGEVRFTIDLRCQDAAVLLPLNTLLDELAEEISARRNVRFELGGARSRSRPRWTRPFAPHCLRSAADLLGMQAPEMPCGAGHGRRRVRAREHPELHDIRAQYRREPQSG